MIYFTAHTLNCVCHCIRAMFRVLGMYNFGFYINSMDFKNSGYCMYLKKLLAFTYFVFTWSNNPL